MYKDQSMLQNIKQCNTPSGSMRFCNKSNGYYQVYRECLDKHFYYVGTVSSAIKNPGCEYLYNLWTK